ncbi:hypothetical protein [Hymenobacter sp. B81]|uniref:hypothetical protein n=1 Tax=Hymenobacter sp. B81 TaxID=3344878 RepID=UPI0037DCB586
MAYIVIKWVGFYGYQFIESGAGSDWNWQNLNNAENIVFTLSLLCIWPTIEALALLFPIKLALEHKSWSRLLALILTFAIEFAIGWFMISQQFDFWMVVKILMSIILFALLFGEQLTARAWPKG